MSKNTNGKNPAIALIGAGSMGGALLRGWLNANSIDAEASAVFDPGLSEDMKATCEDARLALNPDASDVDVDIVLVAIKPQMAEKALPGYARMCQDAIVISVMAGVSVDTISRHLNGPPKIVRAMPNLPAAIGAGATGLFAADALTAADRERVDGLIATSGLVQWVDDETGIDLVTAISGSGPAYFFLLAEALAEAGAAIGLPEETAQRLARATLTGTGALIETETRSPAQMRKAVTSPGGTTEAALGVLDGDDNAIRTLIKKAAEAAARRAGDLSG